jgi:hypothetical protein
LDESEFSKALNGISYASGIVQKSRYLLTPLNARDNEMFRLIFEGSEISNVIFVAVLIW